MLLQQFQGIVHDNNPKIIPFIRSGNVGETFINETDLKLSHQGPLSV